MSENLRSEFKEVTEIVYRPADIEYEPPKYPFALVVAHVGMRGIIGASLLSLVPIRIVRKYLAPVALVAPYGLMAFKVSKDEDDNKMKDRALKLKYNENQNYVDRCVINGIISASLLSSFTTLRFYPLLRIAPSIALIVGLGFKYEKEIVSYAKNKSNSETLADSQHSNKDNEPSRKPE